MTTASEPQNPAQALHRVVAAHKAGNFVEAEQLCREIIATDPDQFDALYLLALAQARLGKLDAALGSYDRLLNVRPDFAEAHLNRGNVLEALDRHADAIASYDGAIALRPDFARALHRRGGALQQLNRHDEALASYDRAIHLRPDFTVAHFDRGNALLALKRHDEALNSYDCALVQRPDFAKAHSNRGNALHALNRHNEALASFDRALALSPDLAEAHYNRGSVLLALNRHDEALDSFDRALAVSPNFAEALSNRANALQKLKRFADAVAGYDRALAARPDFTEAFCNRGTALRRLKRYEEALASYQSAIAASPDYSEAHFGAAEVRLQCGDFDRGWEDYEWRWQAAALRSAKRILPQPRWHGQDDIAGKTILVHAEQGFGDTIQFCRYVPLLAERGARVILQVREPVRELMSGLAGATQVLSMDIMDSALPDLDVQCPLLSLPLAFKTQLETIPSAVPYLRTSPQKAMDWGTRLGAKRRPRIGLAWSGRTETLEEAYRSVFLGTLLPLFDTDATFISLQLDVRSEDAPVLNSRSDLLQFSDEIKDFADTAAIISHLDLVISIDTAVAHLAGALAKPVWVMLLFDADWRWLLDREDSPWYPTARLFRQDESRAWENVVARVQAALRDFIQKAS